MIGSLKLPEASNAIPSGGCCVSIEDSSTLPMKGTTKESSGRYSGDA